MDLSRKQMRGKMIGFRIKYWRRQDKEDASVFYLSRSTRNEALIVGLMPDTYYWVRVMAYNGAGSYYVELFSKYVCAKYFRSNRRRAAE